MCYLKKDIQANSGNHLLHLWSRVNIEAFYFFFQFIKYIIMNMLKGRTSFVQKIRDFLFFFFLIMDLNYGFNSQLSGLGAVSIGPCSLDFSHQ